MDLIDSQHTVQKAELLLRVLWFLVHFICTGDLPDLNLRLQNEQDWTEQDWNGLARYLSSVFTHRGIRTTDVKKRYVLLKALLSADESTESVVAPEPNANFNWLMDILILFNIWTGSPASRSLFTPKRVSLQKLSSSLSLMLHCSVDVQLLGFSILHWSSLLSESATEVQENLPIGARVVPCDLAGYLGFRPSPLHKSVRGILHQRYVEFYDQFIQFYPYRDNFDAIDLPSPFPQAVLPRTETMHTDHYIENGIQIREYSPNDWNTDQPRSLPVFIWFAGGGWRSGDITSDENVLRWISATARCRAFNVKYPRKPFPTPYHGALSAFDWIRTFTKSETIAVGGVSSGGPLAAGVTLQKSLEGLPIASLLLLAACLDNTKNCEQRWKENMHAPWLTPETMRLYQSRYLPDDKLRSEENWKASPVYAPTEVLITARNFPTWIGAMGIDILYQESLDFGDRLKKQGCVVTVREFPNYPHTALLIPHILGMDLVEEMAGFLEASFAMRLTKLADLRKSNESKICD